MYLLQIFSLNLQFIFPFSWPWTYRILHKYSKYVSSVPWKIQGKCTFGEGWDTTPRRRQWHPTPGLLPGKARGRRSLVGYCPWGHKESDTTERLKLSLSCTHSDVQRFLYADLNLPIENHVFVLINSVSPVSSDLRSLYFYNLHVFVYTLYH